jgi:Zn-dependent protease with chaperone function
MRDWSTRIGRKWFFVIAIYVAVFSILTFVIDLPRAYYEEFVRDHAYGLSNQTFQKWFSDSVISLVVGIIGGTLFLWIPYLLLRKSPRRWWLYTGLAAVPFLLLMIVVKPVWIDPLFNTFGPMKDKTLETRILQLADRAGIAGSRVYEVDKSTDTNALNAYVTGIGATKRIVLWDTIIKRLDEPQLLFVMGHEMGHYVLGHMWKLVAMFAVVILLTLFGIHLTAGAVIARYRGRIGFESLGDIASLPLLLLLFNLGFLIASPFALAYNRHVEHEADRFGLEITRDNHSAAMAFVKLQQDNLANPRPHWLLKLLRANHPPLGERIDFCNSYRPWEQGQPLAYEHLFK